MFDIRAFLQRSINNGLGRNRLSTSLSLVGRDDDTTATVVGSVSERFGGETGKDGRVDGTNSSTSEERSSGLPVMFELVMRTLAVQFSRTKSWASKC